MIEQRGRVIARAGAYVTVELGASTGCAVCDAGRGCGAGIFARLLSPRPTRLRLLNVIDAPVGMAVQVAIAESVYLKLLLRLYLLPLIAGLAGAMIGLNVGRQVAASDLLLDGMTLALAVLCCGLVLALNRHREVALADQLDIHLLAASA